MFCETKKCYLIVLFFMALLFSLGCAPLVSSTTRGDVYVDAFQYDSLEGYGEWNSHARFGRVWRPHVTSGWRPFYYGHWVWSIDGWLWISYEPFGWITAHHGHWYFDPYLGWVWVPGYRWYPAVVVWMQFDDYLGWAPMPPPGQILADPWGQPPVIIWNFVYLHHFQKEYIGNYIVRTPLPKPVRRNIIKKAPDVRVIEKITKTRITPVPIQKESVEIEKKTYQRMLVPKREADKIKRHEPNMKNILKPPAAVKKPPVKKPNSPPNENL